MIKYKIKKKYKTKTKYLKKQIDEEEYVPENFANTICKKYFILNKYLIVTLEERKELNALDGSQQF